MDNDFQFACLVDEVPDGGMRECEIDDDLVLVCRVGQDFFCIDDVCTHDGGTLADGGLHGCEIECPRHGARFDLRTGKATRMPATQPTRVHEVKVEDGRVLVRLK